MVHGEADGLPALIVDRYGDYLVIQTLSEGMERLKPRLVELLDELARPRGILERNDAKVRTLEGLPLRLELLSGHVPAKVDVDEAGSGSKSTSGKAARPASTSISARTT